jgi:hypothetical protein
MKKPFTDKEQKVMDLLTEAHNNFIELDRTHPMEITEWVSNFHKLQDLLGARVLRRDYPGTFASIVPVVMGQDEKLPVFLCKIGSHIFTDYDGGCCVTEEWDNYLKNS